MSKTSAENKKEDNNRINSLHTLTTANLVSPTAIEALDKDTYYATG